MKVQSFVLTPDQHPPALNVLGVQVTILAANAPTQPYGITLQQGDEGMGPPPHSHDWDESFFVLHGEIEFVCDGNTHACRPGTLVHVPRGTVHSFQFRGSGSRMLEMTGQDATATQMFTALSNQIPAGPPDLEKVVEVLGGSGCTLAA